MQAEEKDIKTIYRDRTIPSRRERRLREQDEKETIRFALQAKSASAAILRGDEDDD